MQRRDGASLARRLRRNCGHLSRGPDARSPAIGKPVARLDSPQRRHHAVACLPVFDLLFETPPNPPAFAEQQGFYAGASSRMLDRTAFRDVAQEKEPPLLQGRLSGS